MTPALIQVLETWMHKERNEFYTGGSDDGEDPRNIYIVELLQPWSRIGEATLGDSKYLLTWAPTTQRSRLIPMKANDTCPGSLCRFAGFLRPVFTTLVAQFLASGWAGVG